MNGLLSFASGDDARAGRDVAQSTSAWARAAASGVGLICGGDAIAGGAKASPETRTVTRAPWPPPSFSFFAARCPLPGAPRRLSTSAAVAAGEAPSRTAGVESEEEKAGVVSMKGVKISGRTLYLDKQATTPIDPRVDAMLPFYLARFGNPHS
ncbi:DegT/DnrJ/EryC1/StrS aminotransferase family [Musa troglodytarum]|uniref:DegT/DnrJ/EryC1/StrS aminotransferase family n=1 Tax=Musa troglodytarum TaxID=320322 RepID=A0A9E7HZ93_9LILI|nr:DegT/DnrJ/EryC1/StrS aminotransferase family [Musa troglodytarum]